MPGYDKQAAAWICACRPVVGSCRFRATLDSPASCSSTSLVCLLTAAVGVDVLLQRRYVPVPAQSVNLLRVWGPAEELKGFLVGLGGAEPRQVAAWGEVVIQGHRQGGLLTYLKQEAKLKGCRNKSSHRITGCNSLRRNTRPATKAELHQMSTNQIMQMHKRTYFDFGKLELNFGKLHNV